MNYKNVITLKQSDREVTFIECFEGNYHIVDTKCRKRRESLGIGRSVRFYHLNPDTLEEGLLYKITGKV
jgi:hypothetical protein